MNKTFKLIKSYPGSPELGKEIKPHSNNDLNNPSNYYWAGSWFNPLDFSEFWEEVIEKDYEILSVLLQRSDKHEIRDVSKYLNTGYIEALINCDGNKIHSIKRLLDNEIFTIGDKIEIRNLDSKIDSFYIKNDCLMLTSELSNCGDYLNNIIKRKQKQKLFISEDGVDIFEGDGFHYVSLEFKIYNRIATNDYIKLEIYKDFSTKEKAEEFIFMNKPVLSINDLLMKNETYYPANKTIIGVTFSKLKELVKQKLNK